MPLVRRRVLLKRTGNSYSCSGNCSSNYCASYCAGLDGCYNCSNSCSSNCSSDCVDTCASDCIKVICKKDAVICPELETCVGDCSPIQCHNCALADTCTNDNIRPCEEGPVCTCNTDCPQKFQTDNIISPCKIDE